MTTDYEPIDCDQHSVLELLAMRRVVVNLRAVDEKGLACVLRGAVVDVLTRDRAEYLIVRDTGGGDQAVRLDRLHALYDTHGRPLWRQKNTATGSRPISHCSVNE